MTNNLKDNNFRLALILIMLPHERGRWAYKNRFFQACVHASVGVCMHVSNSFQMMTHQLLLKLGLFEMLVQLIKGFDAIGH